MFGRYRRMSGANYHVSVQLIRESEQKPKIISTLKLICKLNVSNVAGLSDVVTECDVDITISDAESKSFVSIAG